MVTIGWTCFLLPVALIVYAYAVYPLLLWIIGNAGRSEPLQSTGTPFVSIVVPAYNEESQIRGAIEALIGQDYPASRRQILVLSDASTDRTDEIVAEYRNWGVELLRMPVRGGKTAAENAACSSIRGEIVVNSDASVRLHPSAVQRLVYAMADPTVGVASTRDVSITHGEPAANVAEAGYVGYEMRLRALETRAGGIVGASGSGYAIRAVLHSIPVRDDLSRDFAAALTARAHGYSAVSVEDAVCYVPRTPSLHIEYRRKVRTVARGVETLLSQSSLLDPTRYGLFSWKLLSHKLCRWLVSLSAIPGIVGLLLLSTRYSWAVLVLAAGLVLAAVSGFGAVWNGARALPRMVSAITFAAAANFAVIHAVLRVTIGHEDHLWEPTRRSA